MIFNKWACFTHCCIYTFTNQLICHPVWNPHTPLWMMKTSSTGRSVYWVRGDFKTQLSGSGWLSLFRTIETNRNRTEPLVNRRLGFEIFPKLILSTSTHTLWATVWWNIWQRVHVLHVKVPSVLIHLKIHIPRRLQILPQMAILIYIWISPT